MGDGPSQEGTTENLPAAPKSPDPEVVDQERSVQTVESPDVKVKKTQRGPKLEHRGVDVPPPLVKDCLKLAEDTLALLGKLHPLARVGALPPHVRLGLAPLNSLASTLKNKLAEPLVIEIDETGDEGSDDEKNDDSSDSSSVSSRVDIIDIGPPPPFPVGHLVVLDADLCRVHRAPMDEWRRKWAFGPVLPPRQVVIQAFYNRLTPKVVAASAPANASEHAGKAMATTQSSSESKNLQRVHIHSPVIHLELEKMFSGAQFVPSPITIAPPFKLLVEFLPQLRDRLAAVETELEDERKTLGAPVPVVSEPPPGPPEATRSDDEQGSTGDSGKDNNQDGPAKDGDSNHDDTDSTSAQTDNDGAIAAKTRSPPRSLRERNLQRDASHLKLLLDFIEEDLHDVLELRSQIASGTLEEILFEDLWHLFKPGDIILSTRGPNKQLFRICAVTGGAIQLRNHTREESEHMDRLRGQTMRRGPTREAGLEDILREESSGLGLWTPFTIDCYVMAYDGTEIGPVDHCKRIKHYSGKRAIRDLDVYPLRFHPNGEELLKQMEERGRRVLNSYGHRRYRGDAINSTGTEKLEDIRSDVFIDMKTYYSTSPFRNTMQFPGQPPPPPNAQGRPADLGHLLKTKSNPTETSEQIGKVRVFLAGHEVDAKLSEDFMAANRVSLQARKADIDQLSAAELQLLQYPVVGYAFRYRRWFFLDIDLVQDVDLDREAQESGFNELVMPQRYRDLLVALVDNHISGSRQTETVAQGMADEESAVNQIDLVKGKGQGVIVLLHGPPGSGKTSTAETIAAYTKRPLYHLTFGDIGTVPDMVERNLVSHAKRANKWGCVLLLDEADVFLRQRDWNDMHHNALVSVFLRELEYYSGILFLTTNRPGVLDEAFKSRIHITLQYPNVNLDSTRTMWTNILNRIERDNASNDVKVSYSRDELLDFAERHYRRCEGEGAAWNGRQIRNAFRTALAIGYHDRLRILREEGITPAQAAKSGKKKWMRVKLTKGNFQKIAKTSLEFEQYISSLRGRDSDNVRDAEVRDDFFSELGAAMQLARKEYGSVGSRRKGGSRALPSSSGKTKKTKAAAKEPVEEDDEDEDEETEEEDGYEDEDEDDD